jgi:CRP/FNR family transcriptional regulator
LLDLRPRGSNSVTLTISKGQFASNLGTVSETLSRTFRKLSEEGTIAVDGKTITILDADRLEDLASAQRDS